MGKEKQGDEVPPQFAQETAGRWLKSGLTLEYSSPVSLVALSRAERKKKNASYDAYCTRAPGAGQYSRHSSQPVHFSACTSYRCRGSKYLCVIAHSGQTSRHNPHELQMV